jgi:two-component system response regulator YesN
MFRVLIVEDEFIVRYGIRSMIDWEKVGMTVIGEAANGQEALDLIGQELPDILITDIKMPILDGIALITQVRKISPQMKILILSNLEDFQYAKEAIRHGVSEYLIKSDMMPRDFEQALLKVKEAIEESSHTNEEKRDTRIEPMWKEKVLLDLVQGTQTQTDSQHIKSMIESIGLLDVNLPLYAMHISKNALEQGISEGQAYIRKALESPLIKGLLRYEVFSDKQGEMNVLLFPDMPAVQGQKLVREIAQSLLIHLSDTYTMRCTIGISSGIHAWSELHLAYQQAMTAAKYKMFVGGGKVIANGVDYVPMDSGQIVMKVSTSHIHSMVYAFQSKELQTYLETLFGQLAYGKDYDMVQIISLELLIMLTTLWSDVSSDQQSVLHLKKQYFDQLSKLETIDQTRAWFMRSFDELVKHMIQIYNSDRNSIIKATQYVQQYYHLEISLQSISSFVHLSKNYFANLFKKEMGESFLEHLTRIRIEKAKTLLTGELKTADIGNLVGIPDPKYFSKVFKKITGISPYEYRSRVRGEV